ncbi:MAG: helix-turn-helix transcriptional regulator [Ruminococcaceae bacterium]|nr:helix-turn-helix transcriptional regulator [Oscillospiraceae bacterium]
MEFKLKDFKTDVNVTRMANIHYFEFVKKYHTFEDRHPFRELVYVDSGSIRVDSDGFKGTLYSKQLLIHKSGETHSLSCFENSAPNVIIIGFECDCEKLDIFSEKASVLSSEQIKLLTDVIREGRTVFMPPYDVPNIKDMKKREDFPFGADQMLKQKFETFLIELIRSADTPEENENYVTNDSKTEEIYNYITSNYSEKIRLDDLCFLFGTNKTTICKNFKAMYGDTVVDYLNKLRIKQAKRLMRESDLNLTQLSSRVGFTSIHYFSKMFKLLENQSPSEYMKTIKSKLDM